MQNFSNYLLKSIEENFPIPTILVHHRAALNNVAAQWINLVLQQESSSMLLQATYIAWLFSSSIV